MNKSGPKQPEHKAVYETVRDLILFGECVPGQPLTIFGLAETVQSGVTPVREAIRRLTAEGALTTLENRRVVVPPMTPDRLRQINLVRSAIEPDMAFLSVENCDEHAISALEQHDEQVDQALKTGDVRLYLESNYRFHFTLYRLSRADVLLRIADSLWLQTGPYMRVVCGRMGTANLADAHKSTIAALRERDANGVRASIAQDLQQGMDTVRQTLGGETAAMTT